MGRKYKYCVDEYGKRHYYQADSLLGQGGQGMVFRTKDPDVALKFVFCSNSGDFSERLQAVRMLCLPDDLAVTLPIAELQPNQKACGYVMRLLSDMIPVSRLLWPHGGPYAAGSFPPWVQKRLDDQSMPQEVAELFRICTPQANLKLRLRVLARLAAILARLQARGLVYCDISPNNVFFSPDEKMDPVWLIDCDNLTLEQDSNTGCIFTPGFGAPELMRCSAAVCNSMAADAYSFAVLAFMTLALVHPFNGSAVANDQVDDWDAGAAGGAPGAWERALRGELPWIEDTQGTNSGSQFGIPRELVLTDELRTLFQNTFGARADHPQRRTQMWQWAPALARAEDMLLECPGCGMAYYYNNPFRSCPYCDAPEPPYVLLETYPWKGAGTCAGAIPRRSVCQLPREGDASLLARQLGALGIRLRDKACLNFTVDAAGNVVCMPRLSSRQELYVYPGPGTAGQRLANVTRNYLKPGPGPLYLASRLEENQAHITRCTLVNPQAQ